MIRTIIYIIGCIATAILCAWGCLAGLGFAKGCHEARKERKAQQPTTAPTEAPA